MNQSTVPHTEISLRLTILSEFLFDEEKTIEELYRSWMRRVGGRIIDSAGFEYWCRRFKNNQFDLGYDTSLDQVSVFGSPSEAQSVDNQKSEISNGANGVTIDVEHDATQDSKKVSEIQNTMNSEASEVKNNPPVIIKKKDQVEIVERKTDDLKLNQQFNEKDVPEIFQTLINDRTNDFRSVSLDLNKVFWLNFDNIHVHFVRKTDNCTANYFWNILTSTTTIETADPEKFIVDHLWFVLKNSNITLDCLTMKSKDSEAKKNRNSQEIDSEKLNTLLQSMLNSIDHQFHVERFEYDGFNEDTFLSSLKHLKPVTLERIDFEISWKEKGNYQKMKGIVETDQWKHAKEIFSTGVTPLKFDDLFHCEKFWLDLASATPEDVLRVTEHAFDSADKKCCTLTATNKKLDIDPIIDYIKSRIDGSRINQINSIRQNELRFKIVKSGDPVFLSVNECKITIQNY